MSPSAAQPLFETERLVVREWTDQPGDLARMFEIYSRPEVARWLVSSWIPMTHPDQTRERVRVWQAQRVRYAGRYGTWAIQRRDAGPVVGTVLVRPLPGREEGQDTEDIQVGWVLHPDCWGHGYATEAARGAVARALATGTPLVHAVVAPGNEASMAVARRLGMTHVGRRCDWYGGMELECFISRRDTASLPDGNQRR